MIKVYYLRQLKDELTNTEYTEGLEFISHAIIYTTEKPDVRRVIIEENPNLGVLALAVEKPTKRDLANYASLSEFSSPSRNLAAEIDEIKASILEVKTLLEVSR
uniref:Uncharacterized protein n=1 Tax=viral metagenome TaxID=1070528 RepID=A0A6M3LNG4_9ZZZZ